MVQPTAGSAQQQAPAAQQAAAQASAAPQAAHSAQQAAPAPRQAAAVAAAQQAPRQAAAAAQQAPRQAAAAAAAQQAPARAAAVTPITGGFDLTRLHELLAVGVHKVEDVKDEDVAIVVGLIGSGKSTFVNAMVGNALRQARVGGRAVLNLATPNDQAAVIGHRIAAQTQYPSVYGTTIKYCDTPGLNDNREIEERACASITTEIAVHNAKTIKAVIVVFNYNNLDRNGNFQGLLELLTQLLRKPQELPLLWVFTRIDDRDLVKDDIKTQIEGHIEFFEDTIKSLARKINQSMAEGLVLDARRGFYRVVNAVVNPGATAVEHQVEGELNELMNDINRCNAAKDVLTAMIANMDNIFLMNTDADQTVLRTEVTQRLALNTTVVAKEKFNFNVYDPARRRLEQALAGTMSEVSSHTQAHATHTPAITRLLGEIDRLVKDNQRIDRELDGVDTVADPTDELKIQRESKKTALKAAEIEKVKLEGRFPVDAQANPIVYRTPLYTEIGEEQWGLSQFDAKIQVLKGDDSVPAADQPPYAKAEPKNWEYTLRWWWWMTLSISFNQPFTYSGLIDKYRLRVDGQVVEKKGEHGEFTDITSAGSTWTDAGGNNGSLNVNLKYNPYHATKASVDILVETRHLPASLAIIQGYVDRRAALITRRDAKQVEIDALVSDINERNREIDNQGGLEEDRRNTLRARLNTEKTSNEYTIRVDHLAINGTPAVGTTPGVIGLKAKVKAEQEWLAAKQAVTSLVLRIIKLVRFETTFTELATRFEKDYLAYVNRSDLFLRNYFQVIDAQAGDINAQVALLESNFADGNYIMARYWLDQTRLPTQFPKLSAEQRRSSDALKVKLDALRASNEEEPRQLTKTQAEAQYTLALTEGRMLGKGGFGKVYAVSRKAGGTVALKQIPLLNDAGEAMTLQEIAALRMVKSPSVIGFYGYFSDEVREQAVISLVFELAWGSLADVLYNQAQPLPWSVRLQFAREIVGAIVVLHTLVIAGIPQGMVHCDVKPENFLLGQDLHLKVADFGLALTKDIGNTIFTAASQNGAGSQSDWIRGTVAYASPEACRGEALTKRSDMYSFGLVIVALATQKPVYPSSVNFFQILDKRRDQERPEAAELMRNLPLDTPLIMRMLIEHSCKRTAADRWTSTKAQEELAKTAVPVPLVDMMELSAQVRKATPPQKQAYYPAFNA